MVGNRAARDLDPNERAMYDYACFPFSEQGQVYAKAPCGVKFLLTAANSCLHGIEDVRSWIHWLATNSVILSLMKYGRNLCRMLACYLS